MLKDNLTRAAAQGVFPYHSVKLNFSFRCNDLSLKLMSLIFNYKFSCAFPKNEVVAANGSPLAEVEPCKH